MAVKFVFFFKMATFFVRQPGEVKVLIVADVK